MKLIKLVCPNCNANLEVNEKLEMFNCNYCGTKIIIDDEVKKVVVNVKNSKLNDAIQELEELKEYSTKEKFNEKVDEYYKKYPNSKEIQDYYIDYIINTCEEIIFNNLVYMDISYKKLYNLTKEYIKLRPKDLETIERFSKPLRIAEKEHNIWCIILIVVSVLLFMSILILSLSV